MNFSRFDTDSLSTHAHDLPTIKHQSPHLTTDTTSPNTFVPVATAAAFFKESEFRSQLGVMLELQNSMNEIVFPDWRDRGLAWHRAIYIEAGELLEHMGTWKWWKKGSPDVPQAVMELVDIWHFGLSWYITDFAATIDTPSLVNAIASRVSEASKSYHWNVVATDEFRMASIDNLVKSAGEQVFATEPFVHLMASMGLDFGTMFVRYVGKNALNRFRQANGYKQGTYLKEWAGREDNVHLDEILFALREAPSEQLMSEVTAQLQARYRSVLGENPFLLSQISRLPESAATT